MFRHLKLIWLFTRLSVQDDAAYRLDFLVRMLVTLLGTGGELLAVWTMFSNTRSLAGWNAWEILTLLGVFRMMVGFIGMVIAPNMRQMMEDIRDGRLDYAILKPLSTQFFISVRRVVVWRLADVILGMALIVVASTRLPAALSAPTLALFVLMLAAGITIVYSFWLVLATCAFWFTRITNIEMVFWNVFEAGRYPVSIYRPPVRRALTYVIPLAFLTTFPAGTLVGKTAPLNVGVAFALAGLSLVLASAFWRFGLSRYSGASV